MAYHTNRDGWRGIASEAATRRAMARLEELYRGLLRDKHEARAASRLLMQSVLFHFSNALLGLSTGETSPLTVALAELDWSVTDPLLLGALRERALQPAARQKLGAHYTPRALIEKLVRPTLEEPLRREWEKEKGRALSLFSESKAEEAKRVLWAFHHRLTRVRVLDPACGAGNFLLVALDSMKQLEEEVLLEISAMGEGGDALPSVGVRPEQFLGIDIDPWATEVASLVLQIRSLQWHVHPQGKAPPCVALEWELSSIECRDALLARDRLGNPQRAIWPKADFVIGNPPFLGAKRMRALLGDDYVDALRSVWKEIPEGTDFSLYWWCAAAELARKGALLRFGFMTTNSITQVMNRRATEAALFHQKGATLVWAIADHPWHDASSGASVRIAMTVVASDAEQRQAPAEPIRSNLKAGPAIASAAPLRSNIGMASVALVRFSDGFFIDPERRDDYESSVLFPMLSGRDLNQNGAPRLVIDFYPMDREEAQRVAPKAFAHLLEHVKPGRDRIRDPRSRLRFWRFGRDKPELRERLGAISRYIATCEVSKHRTFVFVPSGIRPDHSLVVVPSEDAFVLGVLSSRVHVAWALAAGGTLENRPRYNRRVCFDPFPFPDCSEERRERIRAIAERLDAHRKERSSGLTLTGMYNALEKLCAGPSIPDSVSTLRQLHDELDTAVLEAYGWSTELSDQALVEALLCLNAERAAAEKQGFVRWIRPERKAPSGAKALSG